ncbi:hypothetical protein TELCIR_23660 [Teladorsagia circumcincta]|uniref:Uncharacterized protein n=1 Tax=Teladorsagia circumcincta TaxID=45464 RepID=A0A2G9TAK5_TELCI|nr:hypothetical protein TELCIR_23660 [Teladorsagia circumcincta]
MVTAMRSAMSIGVGGEANCGNGIACKVEWPRSMFHPKQVLFFDKIGIVQGQALCWDDSDNFRTSEKVETSPTRQLITITVTAGIPQS